jgi:GT2 family glycosyltransferase
LLALSDSWPVIVVDDASNDGTAERLRERFGDRIDVIALDRNQGAAARSVGVRAASTELVAFADDDSWWEPGSLRRAGALFDLDPTVGLLAATVVVEPRHEVDPIVEHLRGSPLDASPVGPTILGFLACGAVVRREAYLDAGGFHSLVGVGGEEELLALDLRAAGWRLAYAAPLIAHHAPDGGDSGRTARRARQMRNQALIRWLRRPISVAVAATLRLLVRSAGDAAARRAVRELARMAGAVRADRRPVPAAVEQEVRQLDRWSPSPRLQPVRGEQRFTRSQGVDIPGHGYGDHLRGRPAADEHPRREESA